MTNEKMLAYHEMITDAWKFLKTQMARKPDKSDEFWNECLAECVRISEKHSHSDFMDGLMSAVMKEIESESVNESC